MYTCIGGGKFYMNVPMGINVYVCIFVRIYECKSACICICHGCGVSIHVCVCMYACIHVYHVYVFATGMV